MWYKASPPGFRLLQPGCLHLNWLSNSFNSPWKGTDTSVAQLLSLSGQDFNLVESFLKSTCSSWLLINRVETMKLDVHTCTWII